MSVYPAISDDSAPLWQGYAQGELRLPWCDACVRPHLPPGPICPYCLADSLSWRTASGYGTVGTFAVVRRKYFADFDPPYLFVQIALEEGPRLPASMPMEALDMVRVGLPVRVRFERARNQWSLPVFDPI